MSVTTGLVFCENALNSRFFGHFDKGDITYISIERIVRCVMNDEFFVDQREKTDHFWNMKMSYFKKKQVFRTKNYKILQKGCKCYGNHVLYN